MKFNNVILYIVVCIIIIIGFITWKTNGFNKELQYSTRNQIELSNKTGIEISELKEIVSGILENEDYKIQETETFGNAVIITAKNITEEQKNSIVEKFNEKYNTEIKSEDTTIREIPLTRVKNIITPFIIPGIATLAMVALYGLIRFNKIGWKKVLAKTILIPIGLELLLFAIIAITRIPLGRIQISLGIAIYMLVITYIIKGLEEEREKVMEIEELANDQ